MRLPYLGAAVVRDLVLLLAVSQLAAAADADTASSDSPSLGPLWIQPSGEWYGIDGTWSNFAFFIGAPAQVVYLSVATALSELWVVSTGGCVPVQLCIDARGGVFDTAVSETWRPLGSWQLGMNYTGMGGNGDYGLETLAFVNRVTRYTTAVDGALVAAINDTDYYQGYIGLGVTQGRFGPNLTNPFISQLVQTYGTIPSHGYGYTAGAYYRNDGKSSGTVASLTLGGYDTLRFEPHDTTFSLDPVTRLPSVRLRGVTAEVPTLEQAPTTNWTSTARSLVKMEDSIVAIIDSSTPYLWLPTEVCERFASALNLKWREDLELYVFSDGAQYTHYQSDTSLSFVFTLSSYENADNFGQPFDTPGVVNITLPSAAFAQLLRYPFKNVIQWGDSSVPYFPLKRSTKEVNNNQYIIGRTFLQEAYMITSYDRGTYSLHQALFPNNATKNYNLEELTRPTDSPYPAYEGQPASDQGLSTGQTVGVVLGAFIIGSLVALLLWFCLIRKRKEKKKEGAEQEEENKDGPQMIEEEDGEEPTSPVKRMFTRIIRKKRSRKPVVHETDGSSAQPVEVGADAQHQVYEMPAPPEPVELDSHDVGDDETEFGFDGSQGISQYEITRRKLDRQLQGPVPTYSPTAAFPAGAGPEKSIQDTSPVAHYRPPEDPSPASSPTYANTNSLPGSLPSPMTPHNDWPNRGFDLPSPMTVAPPSHLLHAPSNGSDPGYSPVSPHSPHSPHTYAPSSITGSGSDGSPTSLTGSIQLPSPTFQRTPIDPSRVVCLGPLPENVQLPRPQRSIPRIVTPSNPSAAPDADAGPAYLRSQDLPLPQPLGHHRSHTQGSTDTLGSNFTVEEETRLRTDEDVVIIPTRQPSLGQQDEDHERQGHDHDIPRSPCSMERIEAGSELIHVPQVAEKRYSWEESQGGTLS
ncbi:aspartic peptidase domain-containing protein [Parachaetomium inaequale]|uniref:Aspartic peptidase domain-containing protein n=1 Tax=Parachaetomium inaequale TaxID=2588326 RepID=A0AAN6PHW3_9PEZI|nr:aspartic peptidase domain-containing protein [Parachaetomium inaequale]